MPRVMEVDDVRVMAIETTPGLIAVHATGKVPTTGWTNPALEPFIYIAPPSDGIWDFDFAATAPGMAGQVVLPISANGVFPKPGWLKGVRIDAKNNSREALLGVTIPHLNLAK